MLLLPSEVRGQLEEADVRIFLENLAKLLLPHYTLPNIGGRHDWPHVFQMLRMGPEIRKRLPFDLGEYCAAVLLHNLDRSKGLVRVIDKVEERWIKENQEEYQRLSSERGGNEAEEIVHRNALEMYCYELLGASPFGEDVRDRIVVAVLEHSKKDDELDKDSPVLTALRIADKLDGLGALGILSSAAFHGSEKPLYDSSSPFGIVSTAEGEELNSIYNDLLRHLEWYATLPFDWAREMVNRENVRFFVFFVRQLGREIAEATGKENEVEADIERALGPHHAEFAP